MHAKLPRDNQIVGAVVFAALMALTGSTGGVYALHLLQRQLPLAPSDIEAQHVKTGVFPCISSPSWTCPKEIDGKRTG